MIIRSYFGLNQDPFASENVTLLAAQQEIFDILQVHCLQGGFCLLLGEPGTGKSTLKSAIQRHDPKRMLVPVVSRTLHSYFNTLRILCAAFGVEWDGNDLKCEKRLIEQAFTLNHQHKLIVTIIDDAHLLEIYALRKLRQLFEEFPKNHNLILIAQPNLLTTLGLAVNADLHSRLTYSAKLLALAPKDMESFLLDQLDRCGLGRNVIADEAIGLIVRSSDGILRYARHLTLSALLEAARAQTRTVGLAEVNRVLTQPHWRHQRERERHLSELADVLRRGRQNGEPPESSR
ncbi:MAG: AAA family ATPase [Bdellovibrionaceae bacterium]|nr:AAA family ATPase [Pseudobdellovibrionaceae bacterium]